MFDLKLVEDVLVLILSPGSLPGSRALVVPLEVDGYENVLEGDRGLPEQMKRVYYNHETERIYGKAV